MKPPIAWHPYLFAAFPVLFLYSQNSDQFPLSVVVPPLLSSLLFVLVLILLARVVLREGYSAALVVSLFVLLFTSYGHTRTLLAKSAFVYAFGVDKVTLALSASIFLAGAWLFAMRRTKLAVPTTLANWMALIIVLVSSVDAGAEWWKTRTAARAMQGVFDGSEEFTSTGERKNDPDIFYIVLDGYGREDVLGEIFQYDNDGFLRFLEEKGFYVAGRSRANYMQTVLSLTSSLNLDYLDEVAARVGPDFSSREPLQRQLRGSRLVRFLRERGYVFVAFDAGYDLASMKGAADLHLGPKGWFGQFATAVIDLTAAKPVIEHLSSTDKQFAFTTYDAHRNRILFTLEQLGAMVPGERPKFVFAHVLAPHPPFVLGADGESIRPDREFRIFDGDNYFEQKGATPDEYIEGYRDQVTFLNTMLKVSIERIIEQSYGDVIIVVQGDHGPRLTLDWEILDESNCSGCFGILNAYYLPEGGTLLYPEISPVNTFRLVLNQYFGTAFELLPDRSFLSTWDHPYRLLEVSTDREPNTVGAVGKVPATPPLASSPPAR